MRDAVYIALHDLKFMMRQRETWLCTFLIPPLVFFLVGTIMGGPGFYGLGPQPIAIKIEDDAGFLREQVISRLEEQDLTIVRFDAAEQPIDANGTWVAAENPPVFDDFGLRLTIPAGFTASVLAGERRRLASAPIGRGTIVLGKWGGKFGLAVIQVGFALLIGHFVLGVDFGPELAMLLSTLVAYIALVASVAVLAGSLATTEAQAIAVGVLTAMVLAALGGCFWPIEITPDYMQRLALLLPTGWMMDAMHKLMIFGREWSSAVPHLIGMATGAWLVGVASARCFRFE